MKKSDLAAVGIGGLAAGIGIAAAIITPITGLVAGAYFAATAVPAIASTSAFFGIGATAASWVLGFGGAIGGLLAGKIAAPIIAIASIAVGTIIGATVKGIGALISAPGRLLSNKEDNLPKALNLPSIEAKSTAIAFKGMKTAFENSTNMNTFSIKTAVTPQKTKRFVI